MVRVNCPPGGETNFDQDKMETKAKAVRVLKPPGGGSSIMFGEEEETFVRKSPKSDPSSPVPVTNGTNKEAPTPSTESAKTESSTNGESKPAVTASPQPPVVETQVPSAPATNGMNGVAKNGDLSPPSSCSIPSPSPNSTESSISKSPSNSNGTSSSLSSPSLKDPDTKNRLFGSAEQHVQSSVRDTPNRKIKDHMRSNIFVADEAGKAMTNGTSTEAAKIKPEVIANEKKVVPPEPTTTSSRGRVPPGGFSSKLW